MVALALLWPAAASAYRPFDSTDAAVAAEGEVEIELGPLGWLAVGRERSLIVPSLILNWGFAPGWEAVLEGKQSVLLGQDVAGPRYHLEDTALSLKGVLREGSLQEKDGVSIATEIGALLPTLHAESGLGAQGAIVASRRWQALTVHLDGAVAWTRAHALGLFGGVILEGPGAWTVRPVAEAFLEGERGAPTTRSALLGAIWRVRNGLSLDAAVRKARVGGDDVAEIRLGLTWALAVGFPR